VSVQGPLGQRLLARFVPRSHTTIVLMYHRVGPEERDLQHLRVRDDRFVEHLATMRRYADIVPLTDVLTPARRRRVAITFDDGYADNLHVAEPLLAQHDAPATVFVAIDPVEAGNGFWQDQLAALVLDGDHRRDRLDVEVAGERLQADLGSPEQREAAYRAVHTRVRRRPPEEIVATLDAVAAQLGVPLDSLDVPPTLQPDEVRALDASIVVDVGSHTLRHPFLSALDEAAQRREIFESRTRLEAWTGRPITTFAYPYGVAEAFDDTSVTLAREAGYRLAVTGVRGRVTRFTSPHRIPRRFVGDWDADTFERRFREWIGA